MSWLRACLPALALLLAIACCPAHAQPPGGIPASPNVVELNEWTWATLKGDPKKVYYVEFYVPDCRGCKRVASDWSYIADLMAHKDTDIVIARLDCSSAENFCTDLGVEHTPTFKVFYQGKDVYTYKADIYIRDLLEPFVQKFKADLLAREAGAAEVAKPAVAAAAEGGAEL